MPDVLDQVDKLDAAVQQAQKRHEETATARRRAGSAAATAQAALDAYDEAIGGGGKPDAAEDERLQAALDAAQREAGADRLSARERGAQAAMERAADERDEFIRTNFAEIAAAEAALDMPVRDRLQSAFVECDAAETQYADRLAVWHRYARAGLISADDVPMLPTKAADYGEVQQRFAAGIPAPTPTSLLPEQEAVG